MSQISKELQDQQNAAFADVGKAFKNVFGENTPTIDAEKERARFEAEQRAIERLKQERARAESSKR